jgi:hypothetical protein
MYHGSLYYILEVNKTGNVRITFVQPLLQWKSNKCYIFWVCICSLWYPTCNAHVPYCHLQLPMPYSIHPNHLINSTIFGKKLPNKERVFWFTLTAFVWNVSHFKNNSAKFYNKCTHVPMQSTSCFYQILIKRDDFYGQIFKNYSNFMKIQWGLSCFMWTDRHEEVNNCFSRFLEHD